MTSFPIRLILLGLLPTLVLSQPVDMLSVRIRTVETLSFSPLLLAAVREHNARGLTPEQIRQRDAAWTAEPGPTPFKLSLQRSLAGELLRDQVLAHDDIVEAQLTDARGALVAAYPTPDDYDQSDEPPWQAVFETDATYVDVSRHAGGRSRVRIAAPLQADGRTVGVLMMTVEQPFGDR
ncbi:MAG: PDC sensor domain-containing protein [Candidatus Competibacterales bacterium]|nr:PDC sensor domain-containing protein [Candidatus Competibacterales bacterium]